MYSRNKPPIIARFSTSLLPSPLVIMPPTWSWYSTNATVRPNRAALIAAAIPPGVPPITTTSNPGMPDSPAAAEFATSTKPPATKQSAMSDAIRLISAKLRPSSVSAQAASDQ
ncbi:MAG: hypothetical protein QM775_01645 [Pirellulales bacterium]